MLYQTFACQNFSQHNDLQIQTAHASGTVVSNTVQHMEIRVWGLSVLGRSVLRWSDPLSKDSYQTFKALFRNLFFHQ
jgi:hypothetical protein